MPDNIASGDEQEEFNEAHNEVVRAVQIREKAIASLLRVIATALTGLASQINVIADSLGRGE